MNKRIEEMALDAGLLNYVDNETPRRCFIDGNADLEEVKKFAELIVRECVLISRTSTDGFSAGKRMEEHFGVE